MSGGNKIKIPFFSEENKLNVHSKGSDELISELSSDKSSGLSTEAAESLLKKFGENRLREKKKKSALRRFLEQFCDVR